MILLLLGGLGTYVGTFFAIFRHFSRFFRIFYPANFEAFFRTAKNQVFEKRISILGPLGGPCGLGKLKLRAWLKEEKSLPC